MLCSLCPKPVPPALGPRARRCSTRRGSREEPGSGAGLDSSQCPLPAQVLFPAGSVVPEKVGSPPRPPASAAACALVPGRRIPSRGGVQRVPIAPRSRRPSPRSSGDPGCPYPPPTPKPPPREALASRGVAGDWEKRRGVHLAFHSFSADPPGSSTIRAWETLGQNETRVPRQPGRTIAIDRHGGSGRREE